MKSRASLVKVPTVSFTKLGIRRQGKSVSYFEIRVTAVFLNFSVDRGVTGLVLKSCGRLAVMGALEI